MKHPKYILVGSVLAVAILIAASVTSFFLGDTHALKSMRITSATPDQAANAMAHDNFYSSYRESTLRTQGTVASVTNSGDGTVIELTTTSSYKTFCNLGTQAFSGKVGDTITILTEGAEAERQPNAVMLTGCTILS